MKYDFLIVNFYPIMGMIFGLAITKEILSQGICLAVIGILLIM